ncbi:hypothetical protein Egran_04268 [Elaphomyces granulatus]|uniref:Fungal-type protein kinase domain-containing protein n=1 Tax=Elaphomyces granulatus TaxID=519963 RepID=A0A232LUX3_9EURO|nr:hypothetical protein Egran_04268 [Elaphomyces granulatus]
MEVWIFDRSGAYGVAFDIHDQPERFIQVTAGYTMMSDEELGLDMFMEQNSDGRFIILPQDASPSFRGRPTSDGPKRSFSVSEALKASPTCSAAMISPPSQKSAPTSRLENHTGSETPPARRHPFHSLFRNLSRLVLSPLASLVV